MWEVLKWVYIKCLEGIKEIEIEFIWGSEEGRFGDGI